MLKIDKFILKNGLKVIVNKDVTTPIVAVNLLYNVGSKDENPNKTGFAHLFEHLMFSGSKNISDYDEALEKAGGENNAFTNSDYTNYYLTLPKENLETAFWLESDRMLSLDFSEKKLEIQKNVVIEEFKETHLNQPYGDIWLLLRPVAYQKHHYRWATIGKEIAHIESVTLEDVKDFFYKYYAPNNAILSIVGNVTTEEVKKLAEKWFEPIEKRNVLIKNIPKEPKQEKARIIKVEKDVPIDMIMKTFHMLNRRHENYPITDLISDILSNGKSSRFYQNLVQEKNIFSDIDAFITGNVEEGLFVIIGHLTQGITMEVAEKNIWQELNIIKNELVNDYELQKVKNKFESDLVFSGMSILNKANNLAYFELISKAEDINKESSKYQKINNKDILKIAKELFREENSTTLYYSKKEMTS